MADKINPDYYKLEGGLEAIHLIYHKLGREGLRGFCLGNAMKYRQRAGQKNGAEDLQKACWYLDCWIEFLDHGTVHGLTPEEIAARLVAPSGSRFDEGLKVLGGILARFPYSYHVEAGDKGYQTIFLPNHEACNLFASMTKDHSFPFAIAIKLDTTLPQSKEEKV